MPRLCAKSPIVSKQMLVCVGLPALLTITLCGTLFVFAHPTRSEVSSEINTQEIFEKAIKIATDADAAEPARRRTAIDASRKILGNAIAQLKGNNAYQTRELRKRMIGCMLELGGAWFKEAERQIIVLNCEPAERQAIKFMALALVGQVEAGRNFDRPPHRERREDGYWTWLASQKAGEVLLMAVDRNTTDVDLLAKLVEFASSQPTAFEFAGDEDEAAARLTKQIRASLKEFDNTDSRSRLIHYRFESTHDDQEIARANLIDGLAAAVQRLAADPDKPQKFEAFSSDDKMFVATLASRRPAEYWDFMLIAEAANAQRDRNRESAMEHYEILMEAKTTSVPRQFVEEIHVLAGELALSQKKIERAQSIWKTGIERVNSDSLSLHGSLAKLAVEQTLKKNDSETANLASEMINRFRNSIELAAIELANSKHSDSETAYRRAMKLEIQRALWQADLLHGKLKSKDGLNQTAIEHLESAVCAQVEVSTEEKISAARLLARTYEQEGDIKLAAGLLDRAVELAPDNMELRIEAAAAWTRAGNHARSDEHLKLVGQSDSLPSRITSPKAVQNYFSIQFPLRKRTADPSLQPTATLPQMNSN